MGKTKSNLFSDHQNHMATIAKALGHPARIAIMEFLMDKGVCYCGDIVEELPLSQSTVSQHLKALKEAGVLKGEVEGSSRCYCVDTKVCMAFKTMLDRFLSRNCC